MKVVHVLHAFPPDSRAGSENYVEALAREQLRRHRVVVFHRIASSERPEYEVSDDEFDGIPVVRINRTFRDLTSFRDTYRSDAVAHAFGQFLDRLHPDLVHFHHVTCLSTTCVQEARERSIPVVFTLHDFWLPCPRGQYLRRDLSLCETHEDSDCVRCMAYQLRIRGGHVRVRKLLERAAGLARWQLPRSLYRRLAARPFALEDDAIAEIRERTEAIRDMCSRVDRFISPSAFLRERFVDWGIPSSRILVADNGFALEGRASPRRVPSEGRMRVAYLGTWIPSKGVHLLVEAFRALDPRRASLDVHGYAVPFDGFDDYEGHLRRLAGDAPNIRFGSSYVPSEVPRLLAEADLLVVPSLWYENSPLTIHEAFLSGVPVVAAGHGGMREFVADGVNGLTFEPGSVASLRAVLQRLLDEPVLLANLSGVRTPVKSITENAREIETIYESVRSGI